MFLLENLMNFNQIVYKFYICPTYMFNWYKYYKILQLLKYIWLGLILNY